MRKRPDWMPICNSFVPSPRPNGHHQYIDDPSMKIGLLGYGKMGKAIEAMAGREGIHVVWSVGREAAAALTVATLREADVVIEFTRPESAFANVTRCLEAGIPVVCGTTGWGSDLPAAESLCREKNGALLWASNFSVGVNLLFAVNRYLASLMQHRPEYRPDATEVHHIHKLDAPSGTAISLLQQVIAEHPQYQGWKEAEDGPPSPYEIPVRAVRQGEVPGTHSIRWQSDVDEITIEHRAHNRQGFAHGALLAAQWIQGRQGVFTMNDVLGINPLRGL
jgi:4-hydroxy-tetrahydrodipicolinate reductase